MAEEVYMSTPWSGRSLEPTPTETEEDIDYAIAPDPEPPLRFAPVILGEKEITDTFYRWGSAAPGVIAYEVVDKVNEQEEGPSGLTVEELVDGTSVYFDYNPATRDLSPAERKLNFSEIVREFSNAEDRSVFDQLILESPRVASSLGGAYLGARAAGPIARGLAAVGRPGVAAGTAIGLPLAGALVGSDALGPIARDLFFGKVEPYTPDSRMSVVAGTAAADVLEGIGGLALLSRSLKKRAMTEADAAALGLSKAEGEVFVRGGRPDLGLDGFALMKGISDIAENPNIPRSAKFLRGLENIIGKVALNTRLNQGKTLAAETGLGTLGTLGAVAGEALSPASPVAIGTGQVVAPLAGVTAYTLSPGRIILSSAYDAGKAIFSKKRAVERELSIAIPRFQAARQSAEATGGPEVSPEDFNLRITPDGEFTLLQEPKLGSRVVTMFSSFGEKRKVNAAQVLVDDVIRRLEQSGEGDPAVIEKALDDIIARFQEGDVRDLFTNPSFATMRRMLERQGIDFTAQAEAAKIAGEGEALSTMDSVVSMIDAGLTSNTREGYLLASLLAQKAFEGRMAEDISTSAGKVFAAYKKILGEGMDSDDAAKALFRAIDPYIQSTSDTASALYKNMQDHRVLFGDDSPVLIDALTDIEIIPQNELLRGDLPGPIKTALRFIEGVADDYRSFQQGTPPVSDLLRSDPALKRAQQKFDDALAGEEGPVAEAYFRNMSSIDLNADDAVAQINALIARKYEGKYGAKGATNTRVKNLLRSQAELLTEQKAARVRAEQAAASVPVPSGGISTRDLKEFRTSLLNFSRKKDITDTEKRQAAELANYFERQFLDETAARDLAPEEVEKFLSERAAANAYYNARQTIFNDGIFKEIKARTAQGAPRSVELLREKFSDLKHPTLLYIEDVQRAARFAEDPIGSPTLRPGALEQKDEVDLRPYRDLIMDGLVRPTAPPPSTAAAEHRFLEEIESLIVSQRKAAGTRRELTSPEDVQNILESTGELGITQAEITAINKVLSESSENGLDLLPNLKSNLQSLLDEGLSFASFKDTIASSRKNYADQNLWWAMANGGESVDFVEILKTAQRPTTRTRFGLKPVLNNLLEPINEIDRRAAEDPRAFLQALKNENLTTTLDDVDVSRLSDEQVADFISKAKESAKNGLKTLLIDYARDVAGYNKPSGLNYNLLRKQLFEPLSPNDSQSVVPPLVTWMRTNGLMTGEQARNLRNSLDQFVSFEAEMAKDYPDVFQGVNPAKKALISTLGAAAGGATHKTLQKMTGGLLGNAGVLVASGAGAEAARALLINARAAAVQDGLIKLMQDDPAQIARFLRMAKEGVKTKGPLKEGFARNFISLLTQLQAINIPRTAAIRAIESEPLREDRPYEPPVRLKERLDPYGRKEPINNPGVPTPTYTPDRRSSVRPPAVPTRTVAAAQQPPIPPRPAPTPVPQSVASAPTQAPASPATRQRYAALFPNDPASSMIRSQGIGGLLG